MIENLPFYIATMWTSSIDRAFQNCDAPVLKYPCIRLVVGVSLSAGTDVIWVSDGAIEKLTVSALGSCC